MEQNAGSTKKKKKESQVKIYQHEEGLETFGVSRLLEVVDGGHMLKKRLGASCRNTAAQEIHGLAAKLTIFQVQHQTNSRNFSNN